MTDRKEKIIIADDDPSIITILKDRLCAKGFQVLTASDGLETLALLEQESPSIVILDLQMPKMNGIEILQEIKKLSLDLTTIILTAYGTIDAAVEAMKMGAYDFIQKPVDFPHLGIVITKALERVYLRNKSLNLESQLKESQEEIGMGRLPSHQGVRLHQEAQFHPPQ